uniref:Uncharacterized protein n=1 Tax=Panagrolaimus sp. PS1159 TaxID=55785 RepID=A0AC35GYD2_9BILA
MCLCTTELGHFTLLKAIIVADFSDEANEENFSLKRKDNSILQAKLTNLAIKIGSIGLIIALSTIFILIFRFCFTKYYIDGNSFRWSDLRHFISFIIVGVTVLIVAVPEGLPLAVTLALAFSIQKMMKDNNLVRNINACETLANVTSILTVKTGTLTTNQMTVIQCHLADKFYKPGEPIQHPIYSKLLIEAICINSSYASKTLHPKIEGKKMTQIGNRIDCALLGYVLSLGQSYQKIRYQNPEDSFVKVYPFYSIRKYMGTVIKNAETGGYRVFVKGGAEIVLSRCKWFVGPDNTIQQFEM